MCGLGGKKAPMDFGVQLFGAMGAFRQDPEAFFARIARMGYALVEPCVAFGDARLDGVPGNPLWSLSELDAFMAMVSANGLRVDSCHAFGDLAAGADALRHAVEAYGVRHIVINGPQEVGISCEIPLWRPIVPISAAVSEAVRDPDGFADSARVLARTLASFGAELWIHNSAKAHTEPVAGSSWLEEVLRRCEGSVGAQLDVGWALFSGQDPVSYMRRLGPALRSVHYKDIKPDYTALPLAEIHCCLGDGCLDARAVFRCAAGLPVTQLVDQDRSEGDILADLAVSAALLKGFCG